LRLTEKGYRVAVLEAGQRWDESSYPETSWQLRRFVWAPLFGCFGIQRISLLGKVMILSAAGVGGGSLNYANTLYEPRPAFFSDRQWAGITEWTDELAPHYEQARRMLGVVENPTVTASDLAMRQVAESMGVGATIHPTSVGVFFGKPAVKVDDPFFGGAGPRRTGCVECGQCMTGCRYGAKNTLLKNYLYLAEGAGAEVHPLTTVTGVKPVGGGYEVMTRPSGVLGRRRGRRWRSEHVVFAAGTLGTQRLLHRLKADGSLSGLSHRLGELTRTNSEAILGARTFRNDVDFTRGVAITSSFHPDEHTHIEPVRYGQGSNFMGLHTTALVDGDNGSRRREWLRQTATHPLMLARNLSMRHWSEQTIIALVMQTRDNSITVRPVRNRLGRFKLGSTEGHGEANPTWIPMGHLAVRKLAELIGGFPAGGWNDVFDIPMTAHFLGGAVIGDSPATGVIDAYHRVFGHEGLHVVDGSAVPANLGVNPALTISALSERAMSMWPNKGETDPRPPLGTAYVRVRAVAPRAPVVPAGAPAALRL
jgi:cholesterol oxidase